MRTHEEFILKLKTIQPNLKVTGKYKNSSTKLIIQDELGIEYISTPYVLLNGNKPTLATAKNKNFAFKKKLNIISPSINVIGNYVNNNTKILVEDDAKIQYLVKPNELLKGCLPTLQTSINKTNAFIKKISLIFPNLKILGEYKNSFTKIEVEDELEIKYLSLTGDLLRGHFPSISTAIDKNFAFKKMAEQIHGTNLYNYSDVKYITNKDKVKIICNKCNLSFFQRPTRHLSGDGCPDCGIIKSQSSNQEILNQRAISIIDDISKKHNNRINCDKLDYKGNKVKSLFGCNINPEHDYWLSTPNDILDGCGCPSCNSSKGELEIESILRSKNIIYAKNKTFAGCKYKNLLKFDFYLPDFNLCIEYDGIQHFKSISTFGGDKVFKENKIRDRIKNKFCKTNKIKLLRIPYTDFKNIENILSNFVL